jgi:hypothetical protein
MLDTQKDSMTHFLSYTPAHRVFRLTKRAHLPLIAPHARIHP